MIARAAALASSLVMAIQQPESAPAREKSRGVAVVELFTSEGCSSCPPADRLLSELLAEARRDGTRVYPLAFHVDYWDHLGWKDPFASRQSTQRQRDYERAFPGAGLYTPQMVVNGKDQLVGSDTEAARKAISAALKREPGADLEVVTRHTGDELTVTARVRPAPGAQPRGLDIHAALVERGLETTVKRGENGGRTLHHDNVARALATREWSASTPETTLALRVPQGSHLDRCSVIVFAQRRDTREIIGAAESTIAEPAPAVAPAPPASSTR